MFEPWVRKIPRRRKWKPAPGFLPGNIHRQRSLAGYSPWGSRVRHVCERMHTHAHMHACTRASVHTHAHTHTRACTCTHIQHVRAHTHACTRTHMHAHAHTCMHTHTCTLVTRMRARARNTHEHTHIRAHMHARTTRAHACAHTHTTKSYVPSYFRDTVPSGIPLETPRTKGKSSA